MSRARHAPGLAVVIALCATPTSAHIRSSSSSNVEVDPGGPGSPPSVHLLVRAPRAELEAALQSPASRAAGAAPQLDAGTIDAYLAARFQVLDDGVACAPQGPVRRLPSTDPSQLARRWTVVCPGPGTLTLRVNAFFDSAPAHLHLARVRVGDAPPREHVVVLANRLAPITLAGPADAAGEAAQSGLVDFVRLGVEHIVSGADHLVFLAALLLLARSLRQIAVVVSGFTLAHSVTLVLGVLGLVHPARAAVEALIGLSIVVVALENFAATAGPATRRGIVVSLAVFLALALGGALAGRVAVPAITLFGVSLFGSCHLALAARSHRPELLRWAVACAFGLVHGLGFAGALAELTLPAARTAEALFGFNLGVELGQLALVAAAWPLVRLVGRKGTEAAGLAVQLASTPILAAGVYWFLTRALR